MIKKLLFIITALVGMCSCVNAQSPENVARRFCEAVYNKDMVKAKSYMTTESAERTPDKMSLTDEECMIYLNKLHRARVKIIENEWTPSIVTVRFYDPDYEYLDKRGRWFCCAVELVEVRTNTWKVSDYGY